MKSAQPPVILASSARADCSLSKLSAAQAHVQSGPCSTLRPISLLLDDGDAMPSL
jgi:hypothetical protein